jgi:hypothetical protein
MKWKHNKNTGSALPHTKKVVEWTRSTEIKLTSPKNETLEPGRTRQQHAKGNETKQNHTKSEEAHHQNNRNRKQIQLTGKLVDGSSVSPPPPTPDKPRVASRRHKPRLASRRRKPRLAVRLESPSSAEKERE